MTSAQARPLKGESIIDFPEEFVVVDIETTGMSAAACEIIEISAVRFSGGAQTATFSSLIKPKRRIVPFITNLTGITNAMVADAPPVSEVILDFHRFVGDSVIVGYNVNFDVNFLYDNLVSCHDLPLTNSFVDVLRMTRRLLPDLPDHKQTTVAQHYGISTRGAHRAQTDCLICAAIMERLKGEIIESGSTLEEFKESFRKPARRKQNKRKEQLNEDTYNPTR